METPTHQNLETATLAGGCFWCTEAIFKRLKGVETVTPGYSGGNTPHPSYQQVTNGNSGHAEAIQIQFNPIIISFEKILDVFWQLHNPTTLNQQEHDIGTQYRSAIFYHDEKQREIAENSKKNLEESGMYPDPIVTEITTFTTFYPADESHKDFYDTNRDFPYCRLIIDPKIKKLYKNFGEQLKNNEPS